MSEQSEQAHEERMERARRAHLETLDALERALMAGLQRACTLETDDPEDAPRLTPAIRERDREDILALIRAVNAASFWLGAEDRARLGAPLGADPPRVYPHGRAADLAGRGEGAPPWGAKGGHSRIHRAPRASLPRW